MRLVPGAAVSEQRDERMLSRNRITYSQLCRTRSWPTLPRSWTTSRARTGTELQPVLDAHGVHFGPWLTGEQFKREPSLIEGHVL